MAGVTVDTSQLVAFALDAASTSREVVTVVELVVEDTAEEVKRKARDLAPVGPTGDLKDSIHVEAKGFTARVYTDLRYAPFVEFGTAKHGGPQPFLYPALDAHERSYPAEMESKVMASVRALLG